MRYGLMALAATTLVSFTSAFPALDVEQLQKYNEHVKKNAEACPYAATAAEAQSEECPYAKAKRASTFNPTAQRVSTSGINAFVPPNFSAGDQRGESKKEYVSC